MVLEPMSMRWMRTFGATSVAHHGFSRGGWAAQDLSFSGRGPLRPFGHGAGNLVPGSPEAHGCLRLLMDYRVLPRQNVHEDHLRIKHVKKLIEGERLAVETDTRKGDGVWLRLRS